MYCFWDFLSNFFLDCNTGFQAQTAPTAGTKQHKRPREGKMVTHYTGNFSSADSPVVVTALEIFLCATPALGMAFLRTVRSSEAPCCLSRVRYGPAKLRVALSAHGTLLGMCVLPSRVPYCTGTSFNGTNQYHFYVPSSYRGRSTKIIFPRIL